MLTREHANIHFNNYKPIGYSQHNTVEQSKCPTLVRSEIKNPLELLIEINAICRLWPFVKDSRRGANSQTKTKSEVKAEL